MKYLLKTLGFLLALLSPQLCLAVGSAELYTSQAYGYGRFEARARFAAGHGVVSSFFLWKDGSEQAGTFWNELDFEKLGTDCHVETNAIYGNPSANHSQKQAIQADLCGAYHTYAYEWTPDAIVWLVDGVEIRRETGAVPLAFAQNASAGMQFHFNVWPGDATFGGTFDPSILPVHEYLDWVQFSAYQQGTFTLTWREDFGAGALPDGWLTGSWASPKNHSTHAPENVNFISGYAVLSLTADNALGPTGAMPDGAGGTNSAGGAATGGSPSTGGAPAAGGTNQTGGAAALGGTPGVSGSASSAAGAGAPANSGGSPGAAGSQDGAAATKSGSSCSFGPPPVRSGLSWAICISMLAFAHRRARRARAA